MNSVEIVCPRCSWVIGGFTSGIVSTINKCSNCGFHISKIKGVPNLHECPEKLNLIKEASSLPHYDSKDLGIPFIDQALQSDFPTLQIGGGLDTCNAKNMIKTDAFLYSADMHLIADAHCLPFKNESFSFVYALAVFEHLHSPWIAADEIFRVLKPGGQVFILTAFMQHLHGYPNHYFNMTQAGLERIFCNFKIKTTKPSSKTSFNQLSYILMDFDRFVNEVQIDSEYLYSKNKIHLAIQEFCSEVEKIDSTLLNQKNSFDNWSKIAPAIEITAIK